MLLHGNEWPTVYNSSGARGFWGEGYWHHDLLKSLGLDYTGACLVSKTTTIDARAGNMPIDSRSWQPKERVPKCIIVKPHKGIVLNSVGLSGPGAEAVLRQLGGHHEPFTAYKLVVSFMAVREKLSEQVDELQRFLALFKTFLGWRPVGGTALQINMSCPNVGHASDVLATSRVLLQVVVNRSTQRLASIPVLLKLNALLDPYLARDLAKHERCDGIVISNTIPWGQLPEDIPWKKLFGSDVSPLAHLGGGGLSGKPLLPIVGRWIREARKFGLTKPIVAGGGILSWRDAHYMFECGADAIELGSVSILRPWRVQNIIKFANEYTHSRYAQ